MPVQTKNCLLQCQKWSPLHVKKSVAYWHAQLYMAGNNSHHLCSTLCLKPLISPCFTLSASTKPISTAHCTKSHYHDEI